MVGVLLNNIQYDTVFNGADQVVFPCFSWVGYPHLRFFLGRSKSSSSDDQAWQTMYSNLAQ
jgi:hypothetical protein